MDNKSIDIDTKRQWLRLAFADAIRNYRDCERLRLPHCFDVPLNPSGRCIFCGKAKTDKKHTHKKRAGVKAMR